MPYVTSIEQLGLQKGLEKGLEKGHQKGESALLRRQLICRFGPLPKDIEHRLAEARIAQLESWGERILQAKSLAEVFGDPLPSTIV